MCASYTVQQVHSDGTPIHKRRAGCCNFIFHIPVLTAMYNVRICAQHIHPSIMLVRATVRDSALGAHDAGHPHFWGVLAAQFPWTNL